MADPQIGSITFLNMRGTRPQEPDESFMDQTRESIDGHELVKLGKRSLKVSLQTLVDVSSPSSAKSTYRALIGTFVTITPAEGGPVSDCFIWHVSVGNARPTKTHTGGINNGDWMLPAQWIVSVPN